MKKLTIICFLLTGLMALAQPIKHTISGTVLNQKDNKPIAGASIIVQGKSIGAVTDAKGHYQLSVPAGALQFKVTYIGYKTQLITLGKGDELNIFLSPATK